VVSHHRISWRGASGAARSGRRNRRVALAAVAAMRKLMEMQTAGQLSLLEVSGDVLVWHLLHAGLEEVGFLRDVRA
jgi:hypothetical protein